MTAPKTARPHVHSRGRYIDQTQRGLPICSGCREANNHYNVSRGSRRRPVAKQVSETDVRAMLDDDCSEAVDFAVAKVQLRASQSAWKPGGQRIPGSSTAVDPRVDGVVIYGPARVTYVRVNGRITWQLA